MAERIFLIFNPQFWEPMKLIDGKATAARIKEGVADEVKRITSRGEKVPHLATVIVGDDPASQTYVNGKVKACKEVGFHSTQIGLSDTISEADLLDQIDQLNRNDQIDGFIIQLPLPSHIDEKKVIMAIDPTKDVDGFHPQNLGKMVLNMPTIIPATPYGILQLMKHYQIDTFAKHCVVAGRSRIVGSPMSILMKQNARPGNCTVTLTHKYTQNYGEYYKQADILISAVGKPGLVKAEMVKEGAVVFDVGITRVPDENAKKGYRLRGDVEFDEVAEKASYITPVPGGVGPMTIAGLLKNTLTVTQQRV